MDLLEHEVVEASLLGGLRGPVHQGDEPLARRSVDAGDGDPRRADVDHVALLEEDDPVGVGQDRRHVGGDERLVVSQPHHERHVLACPDEAIRLAAVHDGHRVRAFHASQRGPHGIREVARIRLLDEVRQRLGVGLGGEHVAPRLQPVAQLAEVLDDPVVDDGDRAGAVHVRVGVEVVRASVGCPAGMREADAGVRRPVEEGRAEVGELARPLLDEELARLGDQRDPRRVVAAILQAPKPFEEDRAGRPRTRVTDDAAHAVECLRCANRASMAAGLV